MPRVVDDGNRRSGRVEGGHRFVTQGIGLTPYAAGQFTTFYLPAYAEQAISGANTFALSARQLWTLMLRHRRKQSVIPR